MPADGVGDLDEFADPAVGDAQQAEETDQEALAIAAARWPREGTPANPGAWLITTARNRAINRIHREQTVAAKTRLLAAQQARQAEMDELDDTAFPDERLELLFTCCHPALAMPRWPCRHRWP